VRLYREKMIADFRFSAEEQFPDLFRSVQVDVNASIDFTVFGGKQLEYFRQLIPAQITCAGHQLIYKLNILLADRDARTVVALQCVMHGATITWDKRLFTSQILHRPQLHLCQSGGKFPDLSCSALEAHRGERCCVGSSPSVDSENRHHSSLNNIL